MRAVGYKLPLPVEDPRSLVDIELPRLHPIGHDVLIEVKAVSVNPVDTKIRRRVQPDGGAWKVLGWDASGTVVEAGPDVTLFKPGDDVFYAGSLERSGTNAEFHLVDERIVGRKPRTLGWAEAAALPLTSMTAWEALFDRLDVNGTMVPGASPAILIIGGAGGIGSMAIQFARKHTTLNVIATASRPETRAWVQELGAHYVIDHSKPLAKQVTELGIGEPAFVFSTTHSDTYLLEIAELIAPQGRFGLIDDPKPFDVSPLKDKSISIHWELMFTRSLYTTADIERQGTILNDVARLVDVGAVRTTLTEKFTGINAENLRRAHALVESGRSRGKVALEGF